MDQTESESAQDLEAQETQEQPKETSSDSESKLEVMEYRTLRAEELRRMELPITIIQLALASFGAILTFGIQWKLSSVILLYPFLMLWLALLWRQNIDMLARIRAYIATHIEVQEDQWERMIMTQRHPVWNYDTAITFLFLCSDLFALGIGISQNPGNILFILVAAVCTLIAALLFFMKLPTRTKLVDNPLQHISPVES